MVEQYPHTLTISTVGAATRDENGDYTSGSGSDTVLKCRAESSSSNGYITGSDGTKIDFSWIVYLPKAANIQTGSKAQVTDKLGQIVLSDTVKRFSNGQLNARVWL